MSGGADANLIFVIIRFWYNDKKKNADQERILGDFGIIFLWTFIGHVYWTQGDAIAVPVNPRNIRGLVGKI